MISMQKKLASEFLSLAEIPEDKLRELAEVLAKVPISGIGRRELEGKIKGVSLGLDSTESGAAIANAIHSLHFMYAQSGQKLEAFLLEIENAITRTVSGKEFEDQKRRALAQSLRVLLGVRSLQIGYKSALLQFDHERVFSAARIISDIRPAFDESIELPLASVMVYHTLKIEYWRDGEEEKFYVALDSKDLQLMLDQLERAKKKAERLETEIKDKFPTAVFSANSE